MNEQKRNRLAAAITVNAILLTVILVAVLLYQLITLVVLTKRRNEYVAELARYEQLIESGQNDLEYLKSEQHLLELALQYGFYFPND